MTLHEEIILNKYGQDIVQESFIEKIFIEFNLEKRRVFLKDIAYLIIQSKPNLNDIDEATQKINLKKTFTPCVLLKKNGIKLNSFERVIALPEDELIKVLKLFLSLFSIAYKRRFLNEKNEKTKWWYWDLSELTDKELLIKISNNF